MQAMVFNDQEMLENKAAGQTLYTAINQWMKLVNGKSITALCK